PIQTNTKTIRMMIATGPILLDFLSTSFLLI
ncbi:MAG: hypothetical protein ACI8S6_003500, partial [Myxococcota bacterium]